ncbi:MAG: hypothetical protein IPK82_32280 [Polyangiaceae bacterium]|nr:hypothetical protein [Polyangiaceae bacterium]
MDQAQITVLRLQGQEPPPQPVAQPAAQPGLIPGLPPDLQAVGQQVGAAINQVVPGLIPPGLLPGMQPTQPTQPAQPPQPRFKNFIILAQMPLTDESVKNEILDVFGSDKSFQADRGNCFFPGMGISMQRAPQNNQAPQPPVDLLISLSCNQAMGDGFRWPYPYNGFTPEAHQRLTKVFEKLWGPVPSGA